MTAVPLEASPDDAAPPVIRPQLLVLMFCGVHLVAPGSAVSTASLVDVLVRAGVGEHAARSTVARMLRRGSLERRRIGKHSVLSPGAHIRSTLQEGGERAWRSPVNRTWDGQWTLLGFSVPGIGCVVTGLQIPRTSRSLASGEPRNPAPDDCSESPGHRQVACCQPAGMSACRAR